MYHIVCTCNEMQFVIDTVHIDKVHDTYCQVMDEYESLLKAIKNMQIILDEVEITLESSDKYRSLYHTMELLLKEMLLEFLSVEAKFSLALKFILLRSRDLVREKDREIYVYSPEAVEYVINNYRGRFFENTEDTDVTGQLLLEYYNKKKSSAL